MTPDELPQDLIAGLDVRAATPLRGGDIARAYRLETPTGLLFLKTHPRPSPGLFAREAQGLAALRTNAPQGLGIPRVLRATDSGLVLEWIDDGGVPSRDSEVALGHQLAHLHSTGRRLGQGAFGGLGSGSDVGYLGSVAVDLTPTQSWPDFYVRRRLAPLVERAVGEGRLDPAATNLLAALAPRAATLCGPITTPALLHGDLWGGNRLVDTAGRNWLIDPACFWGHPEVDLAMMQLFGGFGPECLAAYQEVSPLADGWRERVPWYQLAPLLVHAILFGGGYGAAAMRVLTSYR